MESTEALRAALKSQYHASLAMLKDADPIAREACRQIHAWYSSLFAEMVQKMRAIDEGGSTLLDNSMILYTSYMADGGHGTQDYPAMLVGRAGGSIKTGRHIAFQKNTPVSNLYVEMLDRMDVKVDSFGESQTSKNAAVEGPNSAMAPEAPTAAVAVATAAAASKPSTRRRLSRSKAGPNQRSTSHAARSASPTLHRPKATALATLLSPMRLATSVAANTPVIAGARAQGPSAISTPTKPNR